MEPSCRAWPPSNRGCGKNGQPAKVTRHPLPLTQSIAAVVTATTRKRWTTIGPTLVLRRRMVSRAKSGVEASHRETLAGRRTHCFLRMSFRVTTEGCTGLTLPPLFVLPTGLGFQVIIVILMWGCDIPNAVRTRAATVKFVFMQPPRRTTRLAALAIRLWPHAATVATQAQHIPRASIARRAT